MATIMDYDTSSWGTGSTKTTGNSASGSSDLWGGIVSGLFSIGNTVAGGLLAKDVAEENRQAQAELLRNNLLTQKAITERQVALQGSNPAFQGNNLIIIVIAVVGIMIALVLVRK